MFSQLRRTGLTFSALGPFGSRPSFPGTPGTYRSHQSSGSPWGVKIPWILAAPLGVLARTCQSSLIPRKRIGSMARRTACRIGSFDETPRKRLRLRDRGKPNDQLTDAGGASAEPAFGAAVCWPMSRECPKASSPAALVEQNCSAKSVRHMMMITA